MTIKLPTKFETVLKDESRIFVYQAIENLKNIFNDNKLEFFPDFTDHGTNHIEEVLETAANIIDDSTYEYLNEKDIAVLIVSILLHDVGMHLKKEGLKKILDEDFDKWRIAEFDKNSWKTEWSLFFQEAKRFNDEQLINIFGNQNQNINEPNIDELDNYDRKLFGEFLRRFHHRLAHEIAFSGFPSQIGEENINIRSEKLDNDILNLSGLVARSHGIPIRKAIDYLEKKYTETWNAPLDIKVVFLMVVIRIADYIQIQSDRAPKIMLKSKKFESPISKQEWEKHNSIKEISFRTADPERIFVRAEPANSTIYLELKKLFLDIQMELDTSWAVLGETYGKDSELKNLKIKYRRIRSNFDESHSFEKTINFVPQRVIFNADPSLLKLLIGPLYGEDPKYGIRELLQNSVDAVKERQYLNKTEGKIEVSLKQIPNENGKFELIIKDSGIGMTEETIINYFFKAGASYRKSMIWKKDFVENNEVQIQKTGRFGVGVLAVFLLGNEFELYTKYDSADSIGFFCKATLGMNQVELVKRECPIGTAIKVKLKDDVNYLLSSSLKKYQYKAKPFETWDKLDWFSWYLMENPKIDYQIDTEIKTIFNFLRPKNFVSHNPEITSNNWRQFKPKGFQKVHWTLDLNEKHNYYGYGRLGKKTELNQLICNGFKISRDYKLKDKSYSWKIPKISVFDNDANFPLSLNRDGIQDDYLPFEEELLESVVKEIIKALLNIEFTKIGPYYLPQTNNMEFIGYQNLSDFIVISQDKYTLLNSSLLENLGINALYQFWINDNLNLDLDFNGIPNICYQCNTMKSTSIKFYNSVLYTQSYNLDRFHHWFHLGFANENNNRDRNDLLTKKHLAKDMKEYLFKGKRLSLSYKDSLKVINLSDTWISLVSKHKEDIDSIVDIANLNPLTYPLIIESFLGKNIEKDNFFIKAWEKILGKNYLIPIDKSLRPTI